MGEISKGRNGGQELPAGGTKLQLQKGESVLKLTQGKRIPITFGVENWRG